MARRTPRLRVSGIACALAVGLVSALVPLRAGATGAGDGCTSQPRPANTYPTYYFTGWRRGVGTTTVGGAYANIWNYSPWVWRNTNGNAYQSSVSAWSMLIDGTVEVQYAQVGWVEFPGGSQYHYTFYQYYTGSGSPQGNLTLTPQPLNTYTYYTTLYNNTPGQFTFKVAGTQIAGINAFFVPHEAQIETETHDQADQVPGGNAGSTYWEDLFDSSMWYSGSWQPLGLAGVSYTQDASWGGLNKWSGSTHNVSTYDTASVCAH